MSTCTDCGASASRAVPPDPPRHPAALLRSPHGPPRAPPKPCRGAVTRGFALVPEARESWLWWRAGFTRVGLCWNHVGGMFDGRSDSGGWFGVARGWGGAGVAPEAVSPAPRRDPSSAGTSPGPRANLRPRRHTPDFVPLLPCHCRPSLPQAGAVRQAGPVEADVQEMRCQDALRIKLLSRSQEPELRGASGTVLSRPRPAGGSRLQGGARGAEGAHSRDMARAPACLMDCPRGFARPWAPGASLRAGRPSLTGHSPAGPPVLCFPAQPCK